MKNIETPTVKMINKKASRQMKGNVMKIKYDMGKGMSLQLSKKKRKLLSICCNHWLTPELQWVFLVLDKLSGWFPKGIRRTSLTLRLWIAYFVALFKMNFFPSSLYPESYILKGWSSCDLRQSLYYLFNLCFEETANIVSLSNRYATTFSLISSFKGF